MIPQIWQKNEKKVSICDSRLNDKRIILPIKMTSHSINIAYITFQLLYNVCESELVFYFDIKRSS